MDHLFIKDLKVDDVNCGIYLCKDKVVKQSRVGKDFISLTLMDKSGSIDAKIWDTKICKFDFDSGDFIKVEFQIKEYMGNRQMSIIRIRKADESEYNVDDYMKASKTSFEVLYEEFSNYINLIDNEYSKKLINLILDDKNISSEFFVHSAAKSVHHNYIRGLLQHTTGLLRMCNFFHEIYGADRNITFVSCLYHDIGKIYELSPLPKNDYTLEGSLIGHVLIGYEMLTKNISKIENFPEKLAMNIKHCVLAHHGKLEYGAPKIPATLEAWAVHLADYCDSKLEAVISELDELGEKEIKTPFNRSLETILYKTDY